MGADERAEAVLEDAARRAEQVLSVARAVFCALVAIRFLALWARGGDASAAARAFWMLPPTLLACAVSIGIVHRLRSGPGSSWLLRGSVVFDAMIAAAVLASNTIVPFPAYRGILLLPETAVFLVLVMAAGFRMPEGAALVGAVANLVALTGLVVLDGWLAPHAVAYDVGHVALWLLLLLAASLLGVAGARRTRRLVREVAHRSSDVESARRRFEAIYDEQHDAASVVSAALLTADRIAGGDPAPALLEQLREELSDVRRAIAVARDHAWHDALALHPLEAVDAADVVRAALPTLERLAAPASVVVGPLDPVTVELAGGAPSLRRILSNLVVNARQGDGQRGANRIEVSVVQRADGAELVVADDGPGLPSDGAPAAGGTGRGLAIVHALVGAAGGRLVLTSGPGVRVRVSLPAP